MRLRYTVGLAFVSNVVGDLLEMLTCGGLVVRNLSSRGPPAGPSPLAHEPTLRRSIPGGSRQDRAGDVATGLQHLRLRLEVGLELRGRRPGFDAAHVHAVRTGRLMAGQKVRHPRLVQ